MLLVYLRVGKKAEVNELQLHRLLFATTNHIERLDPALSRPGRMDVWVNFANATKWQAEGIFKCFFPSRAAREKAAAEAEAEAQARRASESGSGSASMSIEFEDEDAVAGVGVEVGVGEEVPLGAAGVGVEGFEVSGFGVATEVADDDDADALSFGRMSIIRCLFVIGSGLYTRIVAR